MSVEFDDIKEMQGDSVIERRIRMLSELMDKEVISEALRDAIEHKLTIYIDKL